MPDGDVEGLLRTLRSLDGFDRAACARRARERFTTAVMTDAYERLYEELVVARRRGLGTANQAA